MKPITKERLLKALKNSSRYCNAKPESHIVRTMTRIGFRSVCANAFGRETEITDRERLELAYQGFTDPEKIFKRLSHWSVSRSLDSASAIMEAWLSSWDRALDQKWKRDAKIYAIQRKHSISGLDEVEIDYGNAIVKYHEPDQELELLDSDYGIMKGEGMMLAKAFVSALQYHEMRLYRRVDEEDWDKDDWVQVPPQCVLTLASLYEWSKVWESKSYINYRELQTQGYTSPSKSPVSPEHELEWEFHLVVGRGEPDTSKSSIWFCGRIGRGKPSL